MWNAVVNANKQHQLGKGWCCAKGEAGSYNFLLKHASQDLEW